MYIYILYILCICKRLQFRSLTTNIHAIVVAIIAAADVAADAGDIGIGKKVHYF